MRVAMWASASIAVLAVCGSAFGGTMTFDSAVVTGSTQAPGVWYTDRYAPAGFASPVNFDGDNRLKHSIGAADGANSRPSSFSTAFYNTQGRKYDTPVGTIFQSIDLYVPSDWATTGRRMAGFWGTAFDASNGISDYPIIEFASDGAGPRFQTWNSATGFTSLGLPTSFAYNAWYTLEVALNGDGSFTYRVGDLEHTSGPTSSVSIGNTILQGHNTTQGVSYDIYWDNYTTAVIPLPAAAWAGLALLGVAGVSRRRNVA